MLQTSEVVVSSTAARSGNAPNQPRFPLPIKLNQRKYFRRSALDMFKAQLETFALGVRMAPLPPLSAPDSIIPAKLVAREFGVTLRTLDRWIAESRASEAGRAPCP